METDSSLARRLEALERENAGLRRAISLLHQIANLARESLELEGVCYAALTGVTAGVGLGLNRAMMFFWEQERLRGAAAIGPIDAAEADRAWRSIEAEAPDLQTLYAAGLRKRREHGALDQLVRSVSLLPDADHRIALAFRSLSTVRDGGRDTAGGMLDLTTGIASPLRGRRGVQGVLYADNRFTGRAIDDVTAMVFQLVADHAGRAIENARSYEDVARAARTDALTGLGHHGALLGALSDAVLEARRCNEPLSVAMIDLDDFKSINDTRGHLAGDRLLAEAAERLRQAARAGSVFRYGGEEFTVLLPGADADAAVTASERLRQIVSETRFDLDDGPSVHLTCSVGVATLWDAANPDSLLQAADQALLQAKRTGKNRVVTAA